MTTTISDGTTTLTTYAVEAFTTTRQANNVVHRVIGTNIPAVVYRPAALRTGTLHIAVLTRAQAEAMSDLASGTHSLTLYDSDVAEAGMTFAVTGDIQIEPDDAAVFWVSVGFEEVA